MKPVPTGVPTGVPSCVPTRSGTPETSRDRRQDAASTKASQPRQEGRDRKNHLPRPAHVTRDHVSAAAGHLTDRDRRIALDCYEHGPLTTDQLERLHFRGGRAARRRLERLYELRVLDRFRPTLSRGEGSAPFHWLLDEVGARMVATELGRERDQLRWRRSDSLKVARSPVLAHRLAVNEFFVRLAVETRAAGGALREWYGERTTYRLFDGVVVPDGYGVLTIPDRDPLHMLLELDRGTEPLRRIRDKADRYAKAIPRSDLADADPLVLFLAPSARRQAGIADTVEAGRPGGRAYRVAVAPWSSDRFAGPSGVLRTLMARGLRRDQPHPAQVSKLRPSTGVEYSSRRGAGQSEL
jgi:Replication-relaxation